MPKSPITAYQLPLFSNFPCKLLVPGPTIVQQADLKSKNINNRSSELTLTHS